MVTSAVMRSSHLAAFNQQMTTYSTPHNAIAATFGLSPWPFIAVLVLLTLWLARRELKKPKLAVAALPAKKTGLAHLLFEKRWHPFATAVLIGLIATLAWPLSIASGRHFGLGITAPSANIVQYLVIGDDKFINWGVFLVLGIFLGAFIAAKGSGEFRLRAADAATTVRSGAGGILMGFGATTAGGCSIGNGLVMTAMLTWQGWVGLAFMILGVWTASWYLFVRPRRQETLRAASVR